MCINVWVYKCIYIREELCMHTVQIHICIYTYMHSHIYAPAHRNMLILNPLFVGWVAPAGPRTRGKKKAPIHVMKIYLNIHMYTYIYIYMLWKYIGICIYIHIYTCYENIFKYTYIYTYINICIYIYIYMYTYIH
jgi:hypothetical protein